MFFYHLEKHQVGYFVHMKHALKIAYKLQISVCKLLVHSIYPDWFQYDATNTIQGLLKQHYEFLSLLKDESISN